ncbi:hypothetical protein ABK046_46515, partial [Streptomyces caeruleatus]
PDTKALPKAMKTKSIIGIDFFDATGTRRTNVRVIDLTDGKSVACVDLHDLKPHRTMAAARYLRTRSHRALQRMAVTLARRSMPIRF